MKATEAVQPIVDLIQNTGFLEASAKGPLDPDAKSRHQALLDAAKERTRILRQGALALGQIGASASESAPTLVRLLRSGESAYVRSAAAEALGLVQADPADFVHALVDSLDDRDSSVVHAAFTGLRGIGRPARGALPSIRERAEEVSESGTRANAAWTWARIEPETQRPILILSELLRSGTETDQYLAAQALSELGPGARSAVPAIIGLLRNSRRHANVIARWPAIRALRSIGVSSEETVSILKQILQEGSASQRIEAAWALASISDVERDASVEFLTGELTQDGIMRKVSAGTALAELGPKARGAVSVIRQVSAQTYNPHLRELLKQALKEIEQ